MPIKDNVNLLALDIGDSRIGLALACYPSYLAKPLITLKNDQSFIENLKKIIEEQDIKLLVAGLPRSMESKDSNQTLKVKTFVENLKTQLQLEVILQDEFLTSKKAVEILNLTKAKYSKEDIDSKAATLILEDYIKDNI